MSAAENTARLLEELSQYVVGVRTIVGDGLPPTEHCGTAIIILNDCSLEFMRALEMCGGVRIHDHKEHYVDLRGARVSVRAVERQERGRGRRRR